MCSAMQVQGGSVTVGVKSHTNQPLCDWGRWGLTVGAAALGAGGLLQWGLGHMGLPFHCSFLGWAT